LPHKKITRGGQLASKAIYRKLYLLNLGGLDLLQLFSGIADASRQLLDTEHLAGLWVLLHQFHYDSSNLLELRKFASFIFAPERTEPSVCSET